MFEQKESLAHKAAKECLAGWLREGSISPFLFPECEYNVDVEKPITRKHWISFVPDITIEIDLSYLGIGTAFYFIEIVHTHKVSDQKMQNIEAFAKGEYYVEVWEVHAKDILHLLFDKLPNHIKADKIFLKTNRNGGVRLNRPGHTGSDFPALPEPEPIQSDPANRGVRNESRDIRSFTNDRSD